MDDKQKKILLGIFLVSGVLRGISAGCNLISKLSEEKEQSYETVTETLDAGEHIISVPIDNPKKDIQDYEYHDGYEVIDIEDKYILYVNDEPVKCEGYLDNSNEVHFKEFGSPIEKTKKLVLKPKTEEK